MPHRLASLRAIVHDDAEVLVAGLSRDGSRALHELPSQTRVVQIRELLDVPPRDYEDVQRGARVEILERHDVLILVDDRRADLFRGDLAKDAVGHVRTLAT